MMGEVKLYTRRDLARMASLGIVGTALAGRTSGVCKGLLAVRGSSFITTNSDGILGYTNDGLVAMWDAIDNDGTGTHNQNATVWKDVSGNGYDINTLTAGGWTGGNARLASKEATNIAKELTDADVQTISFCCEGISCSTTQRILIRFSQSLIKFLYVHIDRFICCKNSSYGPAIDIKNINSMTIQFLNGMMSGKPLNPSWNGDAPCETYKIEYVSQSGSFVIGNSYFQQGKFHNVRIYNKFLTQEEITANWNNDKARFNLA